MTAIRGRIATWLVPASVLALVLAYPAPAAAAIGLPAEDFGTVMFAQITESRPLDLSASHGRIGFVWSAKDPSPANQAFANFYYPAFRDLDRGHTIAWYQQNRPDWVVYQCDRKTPAYDFVYSWGAYVPLDVSRTDVRDYIWKTYLGPAIAKGFRGISLDNVSLRNTVHRCGTWENAHWVAKYTGRPNDPAYAAAVMDYIGWIRTSVHDAGAALALNAKIDPGDLPGTKSLIALADIWLDEGGVSDGCRHRVVDDLWRLKFDLASWAAQSRAWVELDKTCAGPNELDTAEAVWISANFLLTREARSYLAAIRDGDVAGPLHYPAALNPPIGRPTGLAREMDNVWIRSYQSGMVVVNPASRRSVEFQVPPGRWKSVDGEKVGATVHMDPRSGAILIADEG